MSARWWLPVLDHPDDVVPAKRAPYEIVVIGCSLGGMRVLETIFSGLPSSFPLPIAVVQHRHRGSNETLPAHFRRFTQLPVVDVMDKQWIRGGTIFFAPANYHLLVERGEFSLSVDAAVRHSRPSIDVLFESSADAYGPATIGIVLTGANDDGCRGATAIKKRGGVVVVQQPETAEAREMPESVLKAVAVDRVLPPEEIASFLARL
jgi:two-component system chemotaxis response regulator CheB